MIGTQLEDFPTEVVQAGIKKDTCGSCYGAESSHRSCCNSCEDIISAYMEMGWALKSTEQFEQCQKEQAEKHISINKEGCRLTGMLISPSFIRSIDWLIGSLVRYIVWLVGRLIGWLIKWLVVSIIDWDGLPNLILIILVLNVSLDVLSKVKIVFDRKSQKIRSCECFWLRPTRLINRHFPLICMLTAGLRQVNGLLIDWLSETSEFSKIAYPAGFISPFFMKIFAASELWKAKILSNTFPFSNQSINRSS